MNVKNLLVLVSAVALATSSAAQAQTSLTDLAKAEKARRASMQKTGGAAKVYTESDRSGTVTAVESDGTTAAATPGAPVVAAGTKKKEKTPEDLAADKQKEWDEKLKQTQAEIKDLEGVIARNERVLASMYNITPARQDVVNSIEADKKKIADLQQSLVALEDERRRAGMPRR